MANKNFSGIRALDKIAKDPRVKKIWNEYEDGLWIELMDGYNKDGCSCVHAWSVAALLESFEQVEEGEPY